MIMAVLPGIMLVSATNAIADTDSLIVSMGLREEYNDNIFLEFDQEKDDFITTVSPGVTLQKKDERTSAHLSGLFDVVLYSDYSDLNNVDQAYVADLSHKLTQRFSLTGKASYKRDSRPDRDIEATGLALGADVRKVQDYMAGFGYTLSELASINMLYNHYREDFNDPAEIDNDSNNVRGQLRYDLNKWLPLTIGRLSAGYSRYNDPSIKVDYYNLTLGAERQLTEIYSFYFDVGGRYSNPEQGNDNTGGIVKGGIKYAGELTYGNASLSHDIGSASGNGGLRERTSLTGSLSRKFAERMVGRLNVGYYLNKSNGGEISINDTDLRTIRISPGLSYRFAEHASIEAAYVYTKIVDKEIIGDDTRDRNLIFVRLVVDQPFFD
jgi:predicted porin